MKLSSIRLTDFGPFESAEATFDQPMNLIRGLNHEGKTKLSQAIQLALTRTSAGVDGKGGGATDKIRTGAAKAIIELTIEGKTGPVALKVQYGPNKTPRRQDVMGPDEKTGDQFVAFLDKNSERMSCVLDSEYFVRQNPETQKAILAGLVLPAHHDFDKPLVELVTKRLGRFNWSEKKPLDLIDQVYTTAYEARKTAKAALGGIYVPRLPEAPPHDSQAVREALDAARAEAAKQSKKIARPAGAKELGRLEKQLEAQQSELANAEEAQEGANQELAIINEQLLDTATLRKYEKAAAGRTMANQLKGKMQDCDSQIEAHENAQEIYKELLASPFCPTCTQAVTQDFVQGKIAEQAQFAQEQTELKLSLMREQKGLGDIDGAERVLREQASCADKKRAIQTEIADLNTKTAQLAIQIQATSALLEDAKLVTEAPPDTTELDAANEEVANWEAQLAPAIQYESTLKQIDEAQARIEEKKAEVADLEKLVSEFGKDGVKAKLIATHIEGFTTTMNEVLKVWGYSAKLSIEPYEFLVTGSKGELPLKELSGSESLMFAAAFQSAVAIHGRIRMVLIDKADTFIEQERNRLFGCVKAMLDAGTLDQAFVIVADASEAVPKKDGIAVYRVGGGKVGRL